MEAVTPYSAVPSSYNVGATRNVLTAVALLIPAVLVPGSGGLSNVETLISRHYLFEASAAPVTLRYTEARTTAEKVDHVRNVLGASITDLAELMEVSRPTVYAWMKGGEIRVEHVDRLDALVRAALELESAAIPNLPRLFKRKLSGGGTLMGLVKAGQPFDHLLAELAALSESEMRQRSRQKGGEPFRSIADVAQTEGIASFTRDT